jgi:hypothetical protein
MDDVMDRFLGQFAKNKNIKFEETSEPIKTIVEEKENINFDVNSLLKEGRTKRHSILDDINPIITDEDYKNFNELNEVAVKHNSNSNLSENRIREIMQEELTEFFKSKYVLTESLDTEIIYFKVGDSLFKGELKLVK